MKGGALTETPIYRIQIKGSLSQHWIRHFEGFTAEPHASGDTVLTGPITDQAALHALLKRVRDLGLTLVSINRIQEE